MNVTVMYSQSKLFVDYLEIQEVKVNHGSSDPAEFEILFDEFKAHITSLQREWLSKNRSHSRDVYEVMSSRDREEVRSIRDRWSRYVTPLAEAWWQERGYGVVWPDSDSEPMRFYKLENQGV